MILQAQMWYLCVYMIVDAEKSEVDDKGFVYFPIQLTDEEYYVEERNNKLVTSSDIKLWKQGLMLPGYWLTSPIPYYTFITDDGYSFNEWLEWSITT